MAAVTFAPTNVQQASMYQSIQIRFNSNPLIGDPVLVAGDVFYFVPDDANVADACVVGGGIAAGGAFAVASVTTGGLNGFAVVPVTDTVFAVGTSYVVCYQPSALAAATALIVRRAFSTTQLLVLGTIYSSFTLTPRVVNGGEGPASLQIVENEDPNRNRNAGLGGGFTVFLLPCPAATGCVGLNAATSMCAGGLGQAGAVLLGNVRGIGTTTLTGTVVAPVLPAIQGYVVCVPYCFDAASNCGGAGSGVAMSFAVVAMTTPTANSFLVTFQPINPGVYTVAPPQPQAREVSFMTFTGTGLTTTDAVRVLSPGDQCGNTGASLLANLQLGSLQWTSGTTVNISFRAPNLVTAPMVGQVCYFRSDTGLWAPAYQSLTPPLQADLTIGVLQPTSFTVSPAQPRVGQQLVVTFVGTGLDGERDDAFLSSSGSADPCSSVIAAAQRFPCTFTGTTSPVCTVLVDPAQNQEMVLAVCYLKAGRFNHAQVSGSIALGSRNPVFSLNPYPLFAGQNALLTIVGTGLALEDAVQFIDASGTCGVTEPLAAVHLTDRVEVVAGQTYTSTLIGAADLCMAMCYQLAGTTEWIVARPQVMVVASTACAARNVFIGSYPITYSLPDAVAASQLGVRETATVTLWVAAGTTTTTMPTAVVVVRAVEGCALEFCDGGVSACGQSPDPLDLVTGIAGSTFSIAVAAGATSFILCALGSGNAYIPIAALGSTPSAFSFTSAAQNPVMTALAPEVWRVAFTSLTTAFVGGGLSLGDDLVQAVGTVALLSEAPLACTAAPSGSALLVSTPLSQSEAGIDGQSTVTIGYRRADRLAAGTTVHFCYYRGPAGSRRGTYAGSTTLLGQQPASFTITNPPLTGNLRAGEPLTLAFTSQTGAALDPLADELFFYRFAQASNPVPNCYCDPTLCLVAGERVTYPEAAMRGTAAQTIWSNPNGVDNYNFAAVYVMCYTASGAGSPTYMGNINIDLPNPSFYTVSNAGDNRVGLPMTVQAQSVCATRGCEALSSTDSMILVPVSVACSGVSGPTVVTGVEMIGTPVVTTTTHTATFVVSAPGQYRVCYRIAARSMAYNELAYSASYVAQPIDVAEADPSGYTSTPLQPSAGQFLTLTFTCSAEQCSTCETVRLVQGVGASCWSTAADPPASYTSTVCPTLPTIQFPNQYVASGSYTVCRGDDYAVSSRVPGTLVVAAANPSVFAPESTRSILINQVSDVALDVTGVGLSADDSIFLMTTVGYTCHDLRNNVFTENLTLRGWFAPSVSPLPLVPTANGVSWIASNIENRFSPEILRDGSLCDQPGASCTMQLCYLRRGMTWAPVPIEEPPSITLLPSNPSSALFDAYPLAVGMYTMVTVAGSGLASTGALFVAEGTCDGASVTVSVGTPMAREDGAEWMGVVRFARQVLNYAVCFTQNGVTTEIPSVSLDGMVSSVVVLSPLFYVEYPGNFTAGHVLTQYEALIVSATFLADGTVPTPSGLSAVQLIEASTECNYMPFYTETGMAPEFSIISQLSAFDGDANYYWDRLQQDGTLALCVQHTQGLFQVLRRPTDEMRQPQVSTLIVAPPNPSAFRVTPPNPFVSQMLALTFMYDTANTDYPAQGPSAADVVHIIDGTLFECGNANATVVQAVAMSASPTLGTVSGLVIDPALLPNGAWSHRYTICYRLAGGTFATVPWTDTASATTTPDQNLVIRAFYPVAWTASPVQPQAGLPLAVVFQTLDGQPPLSATDFASFVPIASADTTCSDEPAITGTSVELVSNGALWRIPATATVVGTYLVCYTHNNNGLPIQVANPASLTIYPLQSPTAAYVLGSNVLQVFSGERFRLFLNTTEALTFSLAFSTAAVEGDVNTVLFSTSVDCASPVSAAGVAEIPASFGYAPVTVEWEGVTQPYLHLRFRAVGSFFICARRSNRLPTEMFYTYEAIGGTDTPYVLTVTAPPLSTFTTLPPQPRAWVPEVEVRPVLGSGININVFEQIFFVAYADAVDDRLSSDGCYLPPPSEASSAASATVDTTLQLDLTSLLTVFPFPSSTRFVLCYQFGEGAPIASVPDSLLVGNPSPITYAVPSVISVLGTFTMTFTALDPIFAADVTGNDVVILVAPSGSNTDVPPDCAEGVPPPSGGVTSFTTFTPSSDTVASVNPRIEESGYFFVCFRTYDQLRRFPVPNSVGGFVFSVGLTGAQSYTVSPSPSFLGQVVTLSITGSSLSESDRVKVVDATGAATDDLGASCTETAPNMDAINSDAAGVPVVPVNGGLAATYALRMNATGTFILCYQSALLEGSWLWVANVRSFTVDDAQPDTYVLLQAPAMFATEVGTLVVSSSANLLGAEDGLKLVRRGAGGASGFDCTSDAVQDPAVQLVAPWPEPSTSASFLYRFCAAEAATVTVCYQLTSAPQVWAEVPLLAPPPTYVFQPVTILPSPFTTVAVTPASQPRPYELFTVAFTSTSEGVYVRHLGFSAATLVECDPQPTFVTPSLLEAGAPQSSTFTVALSAMGSYVMHLGTRSEVLDPNITFLTPLVVRSCDPCSFTPTYSFVSSTFTLAFTSSAEASLSLTDTVRLVPAALGVTGDPCSDSTGPFADAVFSPNQDTSTPATTAFTIFAPSTSDMEYYICYRLGATASNFAIVASSTGTPETFTIFPAASAVAVLTFCPAMQVYFQETIVYNFTIRPGFELVEFSDGDAFFLVPQSRTSSSSNNNPANDPCAPLNVDPAEANLAGVLEPALDTIAPSATSWLLTLPEGSTVVNYAMCFRFAAEEKFSAVAAAGTGSEETTTQAVQPQNPSAIELSPPIIKVQTADVSIEVLGTDLTAEDDVYVVESAVSCAETCDNRLDPPEWPKAEYTVTEVNSNLVTLNFANVFDEELTLALCYRRVGRLLVRLATIPVGPPNPTQYTPSFVPRVGTTPQLDFTGHDLSATDSMFVSLPANRCVEASAVAVGTFLRVDNLGTQSVFTVPLIGVAASDYMVCYRVHDTAGYVPVQPTLTVLPGGPSTYATTNAPMVGRATVISIPDYTASTEVGDEFMVACGGCACADAQEAQVPYGTSLVVVAENGEAVSLRLGFGAETSATYAVCYRIAGSGFAPVGEAIAPQPSFPPAVSVFPTPPFQGQRLRYTFTSTSGEEAPFAATDTVMLVNAARLCWEPAVAVPSDIVVGPTPIASIGTGANAGTAQWTAHVPSLGPNTPPAELFPLTYLLCYRDATQDEFVFVPYPAAVASLVAADPPTFTTMPAMVLDGMMGVVMQFPSVADGDQAYIVTFPTLTDTVCDDAASTIVAPMAPASPNFMFNVWTGQNVVAAVSAAVCFIKAGAAVAEVPQLLQIGPPNPSGYTFVNTSATPDGLTARFRQYLIIQVSGTELSTENDAIVLSGVSCTEVAALPPNSSPLVRRTTALEPVPEGGGVEVVVQLVSGETTGMVYLCYRRSGIWSAVGTPLALAVAAPTAVTVLPAMPRAGQLIQLTLVGNAAATAVSAATISASDAGAGTWCHNFTAADVTQPLLALSPTDNTQITVPIWQNPGAARLCVLNADAPWADVGLSVDGSGIIEILPPNPEAMTPFPTPPRVGQQVTLTFQLIVDAHVDDRVRLVDPMDAASANAPCVTASPATNFPSTFTPTIVSARTTSVVVLEDTDPYQYRSFTRASAYRVCYYSGVEQQWAVVGGSLEAGTFTVQPMSPSSWVLDSGLLEIGEPLVLRFDDATGVLNAARDVVWAAPTRTSCGIDRATCAQCVSFTLDQERSTGATVYTSSYVFSLVQTYNLCYMLGGATAARMLDPMVIDAGEIQCLVNPTVRVGQQQEVVFRIRDGVSVSGDSWLVSVFGSTSGSCTDALVPDFVPGRATMVGSTATTVTYEVEWPISMDSPQYVICYTHNGETRPICTCDQIDNHAGTCYLEVLQAVPYRFTPVPAPTYVGETITLQLQQDARLPPFPVTALKLVPYVNALTVCRDDMAFPLELLTVTSTSSTVSVVTFKHNYTLGPSVLLVCVLTTLSPNTYSRVGSIAVAPDESGTCEDGSLPPCVQNVLTIRRYLTLATDPASSVLLRVSQTIVMTARHQSTRLDDVVGEGDQITFVADPNNCIASFINSPTHAATTLALFMLDDSSFSTIPVSPQIVSNTTRSASLVATPGNAAASMDMYMCYKLAQGTWAPVLPSMAILPALVTSCTFDQKASEPNGNDGALRAMQYIMTTLVGSADWLEMRTEADVMRVVPQSEPCTSDPVVVFQSGTHQPSGVTSTSVITFVQRSGTWKVCYRIGGAGDDVAVNNWSPVCPNVVVDRVASPTATNTGCLFAGQTLEVTAAQQGSGLVFSTTDTFRYISGTDQCLYANAIPGETLATITVGDTAQPATGTVVTTGGGATYAIPFTLLGTGTTSFTLCYTDAAGNQFAVPFEALSVTQQAVAVGVQQPPKAEMPQFITLGQRVSITFEADDNLADRPLVPYGPLQTPLIVGPPYDGTFDGASGVVVTLPYRQGRCYVGTTTTYGVFGNRTVTVGILDPTAEQPIVACYRPAGRCSVVDVGSPVSVGDYNPLSVTPNPLAPRRGQLIQLVFMRNNVDGAAQFLSPGMDRAVNRVGLATCWNLDATAGELVQGTTSQTNVVVFYPAQEPSQGTPTITRSCYLRVGSSWSEVPGGVRTILPANPTAFSTTPPVARVSHLLKMTFTGSGLGPNDRAKIIPLSSSCSATSVPPSEMVSYEAGTFREIPGTADGWSVVDGAPVGSATVLNFSSSITGTFSVCYRLAADSVWTLVYADLDITNNDPVSMQQVPIAALEGELFTLHFEGIDGGQGSSITANDQVALFSGEVPCVNPGGQDVIIASPSRTDFVPANISFQAAAGTRGVHTVCYWSRDATNALTVIWGFPTVNIQPNPTGFVVVPATPRVQQVMVLQFVGFGLIAGPEKFDEVKLIPATLPATDSSCRNQPASTSVLLGGDDLPLEAFGAYSNQPVRATATTACLVCYRLNGGQFHILGSRVEFQAANPSGATPSKGLAVPHLDLELERWSIAAPLGWSDGDFVFVSDAGCNDVEVGIQGSGVTSSLGQSPNPTADNFPLGVASVQATTAAPNAPFVLLRFGQTDGMYSLCYRSVTDAPVGSTTVLVDGTLQVVAGIPPPMSPSPLEAQAQMLFRFTLQVTPTPDDYVVLVTDPYQCQGTTAPSSSLAVASVTDLGDGSIDVLAVVEDVGMYYVCYSHATATCGPEVGRDCARVVGTVVATAADPRAWRVTPQPAFTTDLLHVQLVRGSPTVPIHTTGEALWLAPLPESDATSAAVAVACYSTAPAQGAAGAPVPLVFDTASSEWRARVNRTGPFAACFQGVLPSGRPPLPSMFLPSSTGTLTVVLSAVTQLSVPNDGLAAVTSTVPVALNGHGLSEEDVLVAVSLSTIASGASVPLDICTGSSYVPRVVASSVTNGFGLTAMTFSAVFETTGLYVWCYLPAADLGETEGRWTVVGDTLAVVPHVTAVTVAWGALLVSTPVTFRISGDGLAVTDQAALVMTSAATAPTDALCTGAAFTPVTGVDATAGTALFTATPTAKGTYGVCYQASGSLPALLPERFSVAARNVTSAVFSLLPVCSEGRVCAPQPVVTLVGSSGAPAADVGATVQLRLLHEDLSSANQFLSGATANSNVNFTFFTFAVMAVSRQGQYVLGADVTLQGGVGLFVTTPLQVGEEGSSGSQPTSVATMALACTPEGIIPRRLTESGASDPETNVACLITTSSAEAATAYTVSLNFGTATAVVPAGTTPQGYPQYSFVVNPPLNQLSVNYVSITVEPQGDYMNWPVAGSPAYVRLGTTPGPQTVLQCAPVDSNLTTLGAVRVGSSLACSVQGRISNPDGTLIDVVVLPQFLRLEQQLNDDVSTATDVPLGSSYPADLNGLYIVTIAVRPARTLAVAGYTTPSEADMTPSVPMVNSPQHLAVIGVPLASASTLLCAADATGSTRWFTASQPLTCNLTLADADGAINGAAQDYLLAMPNGGSIEQLLASAAWGTTFKAIGSAPPQPASAVVLVRQQVAARGADGHEDIAQLITTPGSAQFTVTTTYLPSRTAASPAFTASLMMVTQYSDLGSLRAGDPARLELQGTGLLTTHSYLLSQMPNCSLGAENAVVRPQVEALDEAGSGVALAFVLPPHGFFICVAPEDQTERYVQLLVVSLGGNFIPVSPGALTGDDLLLFIVGVVFAGILLLLLPVVWWCCCCRAAASKFHELSDDDHAHQRSADGDEEDEHVVMPVRASQVPLPHAARYTSHSFTPSSRSNPQALLPQNPPPREVSLRNDEATEININMFDDDVGNHEDDTYVTAYRSNGSNRRGRRPRRGGRVSPSSNPMRSSGGVRSSWTRRSDSDGDEEEEYDEAPSVRHPVRRPGSPNDLGASAPVTFNRSPTKDLGASQRDVDHAQRYIPPCPPPLPPSDDAAGTDSERRRGAPTIPGASEVAVGSTAPRVPLRREPLVTAPPGPYQYLHHEPSRSSSASAGALVLVGDAERAVALHGGAAVALGEEGLPQGQRVGPFVVSGHVSRPVTLASPNTTATSATTETSVTSNTSRATFDLQR